MTPEAAARAAQRAIDRLGNRRHGADVPELADLFETHRYFRVYALGRTAPLASGRRVTHAVLGLFPYSLIVNTFERVGDEVGAIRTRFIDAAEQLGHRLFGELPYARELAGDLDRLVEHADFAGGPLAAAWADLPAPETVGARIERSAAVLRELRGAAHRTVLQAHRLLGPEGLLLTALWRGDDDPEATARIWAWRDDDVTIAWERLQASGRVDDERAITDQGRAERDAIEERTNALAAPVWAALSEANRQRTVELLQAASAHV